jgi:hypothetical protein
MELVTDNSTLIFNLYNQMNNVVIRILQGESIVRFLPAVTKFLVLVV